MVASIFARDAHRLHKPDKVRQYGFMMGTETEILLAADEGRDLLDRDNIPNENQSRTCFSCGTPMAGLYCHSCGNKNDNYRRSIFSLIVELFQNITAIDSRMWRSLRSLIMRPGQMSREFSDGARQRWTSPVRMYIATSLLLFGYITISQTQIVALGATEQPTASSPVDVESGEAALSPRLIWFVRKSDLVEITEDIEMQGFSGDILRQIENGNTPGEDRESLQTAIDGIDAELAVTESEVERTVLMRTREQLAKRLEENTGLAEPEAEAPNGAPADIAETGASESTDAPEDAGIEVTEPSTGGRLFTIIRPDGRAIELDNEGVSAIYRLVLRRPELINERINTDVKFAMFFMMPFAMILGAIFIRGREKAMLYDHLVHAAYVHSFSFLLLFAFVLLSQFTDLPGLVVIYTLILLVYLPRSAKGMFGRGWFKSCLTAYGVGVIYTLTIGIVMAAIIVFALQDIAVEVNEQRALLQPNQIQSE